MNVSWKVVLMANMGDVLFPGGGEPQSTTEWVRTQSMCRLLLMKEGCTGRGHDVITDYSGSYNDIHWYTINDIHS